MTPQAAPAVLELALPDTDATDRVGAALGLALAPGDALLLEGPLGAGKSALARAAIAARLAAEGRSEPIPSPTYTLAQVYETAAAEIWHADLYRLGGAEEAGELGLAEALPRAICLIEWPDRLGVLEPARALWARLAFPATGEGRLLTLTPRGAGWTAALAAAGAALRAAGPGPADAAGGAPGAGPVEAAGGARRGLANASSGAAGSASEGPPGVAP